MIKMKKLTFVLFLLMNLSLSAQVVVYNLTGKNTEAYEKTIGFACDNMQISTLNVYVSYPLNVYMDNDIGCVSRINLNTFTINVVNMSSKRIPSVIFHEITHVKQMLNGDLYLSGKKYVYKGRQVDNKYMPHEEEAVSNSYVLLKKYKAETSEKTDSIQGAPAN